MKKTECVRMFLKVNPLATTKEILAHVQSTIGSPVDPGAISKVRKKMGIDGGKKESKELKDMTIANGVMIKKLRNTKTEIVRTPRGSRKSKVYQTVWALPIEGVTKQSKDILSSFIEELNNTGRVKLEFVERVNPDVIEVREYK